MRKLEGKSFNLFRESKTHLWIVIITLAIFLISCNQESDVAPVYDDTNEILLAGSEQKTWLIVSSKKNDVEWLPECMKDDDWLFTRNYQFTRNSTTLTCTNGIPDNDQSTWSFSNNETWLTFGGGTYEVTSLTEAKMVLTFPHSNGDTFVDTWVKK